VTKEVRRRKPGGTLSRVRPKRIIISDDESGPEEPILETEPNGVRQEIAPESRNFSSITPGTTLHAQSANTTQVSVPVSKNSFLSDIFSYRAP